MKNIAVITGGAGGMGLATAKIIGRDHYVVLCDVSQERLNVAITELESLNIECQAFTCDITDKVLVEKLVKDISKLGKIVSVVHTAGVSPSMGTADMIVKINAVGTININEAFLAVASEGFAIVNVASNAAYQIPRILLPIKSYRLAFKDPNKLAKKLTKRANLMPKKLRPGMAYATSKNFVVWYSKAIAAKFGEKSARVLSVSPGSFDTRMGKLEKDAGAGAMINRAALKRFGEPQEIAELLAFCASSKPGYLTGTDILCDGGVIGYDTTK